MPTASIRTCTSPGPGSSSGMSVSRNVRGAMSSAARIEYSSAERYLISRREQKPRDGSSAEHSECVVADPETIPKVRSQESLAGSGADSCETRLPEKCVLDQPAKKSVTRFVPHLLYTTAGFTLG